MRTLDGLDVDGKRVLVRVDFNVPLDANQNITDDARIRAALPTLKELREKGARLVLLSHLGRPKGRDPKLSLKPAAERLSDLLGEPVELADDLDNVPDADIAMVENVRFFEGETKNDPDLAKRYAALADVYVNDAFGSAHRAHASTEAVAHLLPSAAGRLLEREVTTLTGILEDPKRPLVAVVGGAKVTDKIGVLDAFLDRADEILVGGAMCFPFFKAQGHDVGDSLCEDEGDRAGRPRPDGGQREAAPARSTWSPARTSSADTPVQQIDGVDVPDGWMGLDIGPRHRGALRRRGEGRRHGVLERPDGRVRARAVRGRDARRGRGGRRDRGDDGRRRRRLRGRARAVRPRRHGRPPLDRRRRLARADRGQGAARRGGAVMSRTPFICGNWKMNKTIAEAEAFIAALLPRLSDADGVDVGVCPPYLSLQAVVDSARGSRLSGLRAEHARGRLAARSPARSRRRC